MGPRRLHPGSVPIKWLFWCAQGDPCRYQGTAAAWYQEADHQRAIGTSASGRGLPTSLASSHPAAQGSQRPAWVLVQVGRYFSRQPAQVFDLVPTRG